MQVLEVSGDQHGYVYPFNEPARLLGWGIPVIRSRGFDYSQTGSGIDGAMTIAPAKLPASASLIYQAIPNEGRKPDIYLRLTSGSQTLVDYRWIGQKSGHCPTYKQFPGPSDEPRKTIIAALGVPEKVATPQVDVWERIHRISGTVVARELAGDTKWEHSNHGCPGDVGFHYERARQFGIEGEPPFFSGQQAYRFVHPGSLAACTGSAVYIYATQRNARDFFLTVTKRKLDTLEREWSANIKVSNADAALQERETRIVSVSESNYLLTLRTRHYGHNHILSIDAPLTFLR